MAIAEGTQNLPSDTSGRYFIGGLGPDNNLYVFRFDSSKNLLVAFGAQSNVYDAQITVAASAAALTTQTTIEVTLQADETNTVDIFIGNSTGQHTRLGPGASVSGLKISNLNLVWARAASTGTSLLNVFATY